MSEIRVMVNEQFAHTGIATLDIDAAIKRYQALAPSLKMSFRKVVPDQKVEVCFLDFPDHAHIGRIELLKPTDDTSTVARFIAKNGEGLHHICFMCADVEAKLSQLQSQGFELIDKTPRIGALGKLIAFVHPKSTGGVLIEFEEE